MNRRADIDGVETVTLSLITDATGRLVVAEQGSEVPFVTRRVFVVQGVPEGTVRGNHAHGTCTELLVCLRGGVDVELTDGHTRKTVCLRSPDRGLIIPPLVWSTQRYVEPGSILMVLCDRPFEESEYIRDRDEFLRRRQLAGSRTPS
jgi:dTDP-4-dehydrorhamnose 3,5-epimerase-like enzyme